MTQSLEQSGSLQVQPKRIYGRTSLTNALGKEKDLLQAVKSIDDVLLIQKEFATITSLKVENVSIADAFIGANFAYICSILGIELNEVQRKDVLDEVGQVGWLTMADFKLFLDRMKKHKFYRRDYQELLQEFWKYADERLERAFEIETAKTDKTDTLPRYETTMKLSEIEVMKIKAQRHEDGI